MSIITISRGSYSRGKEVAEALAEELGYQCISREILVETSSQFNIPEIKLEKALHDAPSVLDRFSHGREKYVSYFKSAFLSHMAQGNIVYHGLAGHFFVEGISHALKVRINADIIDRVSEEIKRENCSEDTALYNLKKDDEERRKWSMQLYGKDTFDSRHYDMVLSVHTLTVADIVEILALTIRKEQFQETAESKAELEKRMLLANIHSQMVHDSPNVKVNLLDNSVIELTHLEGELRSSRTQRNSYTKKLKEKFGLEDVVFKENLQPYKGHINTFYNIDVN